MKRNILICLLGIMFSFRLAAQLAGTYTIGQNGTENYSSFKAAILDCYLKGIVNTVTFKVSPGIYEEQIIVPYIFGARVSTPVIFESANGDSTSVVIKNKPVYDSANFTLLIDATDYIIFRKMTFTTDTITGRLVEISSWCTGIQFYNCRFLGWKNGAELVYSRAYSGSNNTYTIFINNEFINGSYGIRMTGNETYPDVYTYIQHNSFKGQSQGAVYLKNHFEPMISSNYIHTYGNENIYSAIALEWCSGKAKILENKIIISKNKSNAFGIRLVKTSGMYQNEILIANNFIASVTEAFTSAISITNSTDIFILHNSTHIKGNTQGSSNLTLLFSRFLNIASNIFSNQAGGLCLEINSGKDLMIDYNAYNTTSSTYFYQDGISYESLLAWRDSTGYDNQSLQEDPHFCSDTLLFTYNSNLYGKGVYNAQVSKDIELETRKNPPDIGADEITPLTFDLIDTVEVCANEFVEIDAGDGWDTYRWQDTFTEARWRFIPESNEVKTLTIRAMVTRKGCRFEDSVIILQHKYPVFSLGNDTSFCYQKFSQYQLKPSGHFISYLWQDNSTDSIFSISKPADSGLKIYWLTVLDSNGCRGSDSIKIYFYDCSSVQEWANDFKVWFSAGEHKIWFDLPLTYNNKYLQATLFTMDGRVVKQGFLNKWIDTSDLPAGFYILAVFCENNGFYRKIRIE